MTEYVKGRRTPGYRGNVQGTRCKLGVDSETNNMFLSLPRHRLMKMYEAHQKRLNTVRMIRDWEAEQCAST